MESVSNSTSTNSPEIKELWRKVVRREAAHLLLLSKPNVSIKDLKENMTEIFPKDDIFEEELFSVSTQSRDKKNQVTFNLKEEFVGMFDPFFYVSPNQYSQVF